MPASAARRRAVVPAPRPDPFALTPREAAVVGLLLAGRSNREIADALGMSAATAKRHLSNVMLKWGCRNRTQVAVHALAIRAASARVDAPA